MTIRLATLEDLPRILDMGEHFHRQSKYRQLIPFVREAASRTADALITSDVGVILVAEQGSQLVGMMGLTLFAHPISGERMVAEMFWWVEPESRGTAGIRLLKRAEAWAREQSCVGLCMAAPSMEVEALYRTLGFARVEVSYQKRFDGASS